MHNTHTQDGSGTVDADEFAHMVLETIEKMRAEDTLTHPSETDIEDAERKYFKSLSARQTQLSSTTQMQQKQQEQEFAPPPTAAQLLAARHKISFTAGAFDAQGMYNGVDRQDNKSSARSGASSRVGADSVKSGGKDAGAGVRFESGKPAGKAGKGGDEDYVRAAAPRERVRMQAAMKGDERDEQMMLEALNAEKARRMAASMKMPPVCVGHTWFLCVCLEREKEKERERERERERKKERERERERERKQKAWFVFLFVFVFVGGWVGGCAACMKRAL